MADVSLLTIQANRVGLDQRGRLSWSRHGYRESETALTAESNGWLSGRLCSKILIGDPNSSAKLD